MAVSKNQRFAALFGVGLFLVLLIAWARATAPRPGQPISLAEFTRELKAQHIASATLFDRQHIVRGETEDGVRYELRFPNLYAERLTRAILEGNVALQVDTQRQSPLLGALFGFLPFLLIIGVILFFRRRAAQGGGNPAMGLGKAKPRIVNREEPQITFADVAGVEEAIEELGEIRDFLAAPQKFVSMGAKIPKGVLLVGPPGTGKTLLGRAVAGEAAVPFFSISGSEFVEMFVGVGASRVRDLFSQAKAAAPAIIFMDEIDAVGRHRGGGFGGGNDEREQTLNQLLIELDGFDQRTGVILIAATNRPDILDPALLRPGRFDRQIMVDRPDMKGRRAILDVHARGKRLAAEIDLDVMARKTPGFTGADLANMLNEAALLATRAGRSEVGNLDLEEATDRVLAGPERKSRIISDKEKLVIAYHEAGHAVVAHALPGTDPVHKVTIIPRGRALGITFTLPTEDKFLSTRSELSDQLAMILGGRTAEELIFTDPSTGASNDIERATQVAREMVMNYGMSDELGPIQYGRSGGDTFLAREISMARDYSNAVAARIDAEVRRLLDQGHLLATDILTIHRDALDCLAEALIDHETVGTAEVLEILAAVPEWHRNWADADNARRSIAGAVTATSTGG